MWVKRKQRRRQRKRNNGESNYPSSASAPGTQTHTHRIQIFTFLSWWGGFIFHKRVKQLLSLYHRKIHSQPVHKKLNNIFYVCIIMIVVYFVVDRIVGSNPWCGVCFGLLQINYYSPINRILSIETIRALRLLVLYFRHPPASTPNKN